MLNLTRRHALGFLYALFTLGQGRFELSQIGWWLLEVYFGLDSSGFEAARGHSRSSWEIRTDGDD